MKKRIFCIVLCLCILLSMAGCTSSREAEGEYQSSDIVPLTVYMVAPEVQGDESYRFGPYAMGDFMGLLRTAAGKSYRYLEALESYEKAHPSIELKIEYFPFTDELDQQLEKDIKEGTLPDVIIEDSISDQDVYRWLESDLFLDLKPYTDQDAMYESGEYYNAILQAGVYKEKQAILPLTFNMPTLMTSKEKQSQYLIDLEDAGLTDWLAQLTGTAISMQQEGVDQEVLGQSISPLTEFPIYILLAAAGQDYVNYEEKTVNLDKKLFNSIAGFYKEFAVQEAKDFEKISNPEHQFWLQDTWHEERRGMVTFEDTYERTVAYIEGGSCWNTYPHSFAAQANYYESRYTDAGETFCLYGIPTYEDETKYTAMVTSYGGVIKTTQHPKEAYEFIKYLLDQSYFMHYDLSVNCAAAQKSLTELSKTEYEIIQTMGYFDEDLNVQEKTDYIMKPMTESTKEKINSMIENIGYVTLPNGPVYNTIMNLLGEYVIDRVSLEECYENVAASLEAYVTDGVLKGGSVIIYESDVSNDVEKADNANNDEALTVYVNTQANGDQSAGQWLIENYQEAYPEKEIKIVEVDGFQGREKELASADLILMDYGYSLNSLKEGVESGYIANITSLWNQDEEYDSTAYYPGVSEVGTIDGALYALPVGLRSHYMTIRDSQWKSSEFYKLPEQYTLEEFLNAMESEMNKDDPARKDSWATFWEPTYHNLADRLWDVGAIQRENGKIELNQKLYEQIVEIKAKECNECYLYGWQPFLTPLDPRGLEGQYLATIWGDSVLNVAPQVGLSYMESACSELLDENVHALWWPLADKPGSYAAEVSVFGAIGAGSGRQEEAYRMLREMMNMPFIQWGKIGEQPGCEIPFPVNREQALAMIDAVEMKENDSYTLAGMMMKEDGTGSENGVVVIPKKQLSSGLRAELTNYLNNIELLYCMEPEVKTQLSELYRPYTAPGQTAKQDIKELYEDVVDILQNN